MCSARRLRSWIGPLCLSGLAGLALLPGLGCSRLNLWEGPSYRDDPVVSDTGTPGMTTPGMTTTAQAHPSDAPAAAPTGGRDAVKTSRANR